MLYSVAQEPRVVLHVLGGQQTRMQKIDVL